MKNSALLRTTMTWGLFLGIALVLIHLIPYAANIMKPPLWLTLLMYAAMIGGVIMGQIKHRNNDLGGYITYGRAFACGMLVMIFASIVYALYFIILTQWFDPNYINKMLDETTQILAQNGLTDEQIETALQMSKQMITPLFTLFSSILSYAIWGAIFSLITSAIVKRTPSVFDNNYTM